MGSILSKTSQAIWGVLRVRKRTARAGQSMALLVNDATTSFGGDRRPSSTIIFLPELDEPQPPAVTGDRSDGVVLS